jgi:hypothetical protein
MNPETEFRAELLEPRVDALARRIRRTRTLFTVALIVSNALTGAAAVIVALNLSRAIWHLRP